MPKNPQQTNSKTDLDQIWKVSFQIAEEPTGLLRTLGVGAVFDLQFSI